MNWKNLLSLPAIVALALPAAAHAQTVCGNQTGMHGGYFYSFWRGGGAGCITLGEGGNYSTSYTLGGSGNLVAGMGWRTGSPTRVVGYNAGVFDAGSNSYLTLYGWSTDPLIEYYVVDSWGGFLPPGHEAPVLGTVTSDGGTYNIYRTTRVNQPSIRGRQTFEQYWSVRTTRRPIGVNQVITFANHVAAWRSHRMTLGTMNYQIMATEGFGSNGGSNLTVWEQ